MTTTSPIWYELRNAVHEREFGHAKKLLAENPNLLQATNGIGETVMHFLAVENDIDSIVWLHSHGFNVNAVNAFGTPMIFEVAQLGYKDLFVWLVSNGADASVRDSEGLDICEHLAQFKEQPIPEWVRGHVA